MSPAKQVPGTFPSHPTLVPHALQGHSRQKEKNWAPLFFDAFLSWCFLAGHLVFRGPPLHLPHPEGRWWQVSALIRKSQPSGMAFVIFATLVPLPRQDEDESDVTYTSSLRLGHPELPLSRGGGS